MSAAADTYLRCTRCGREGTTSFARSLADGWPRCCGHTMRLERTDADIAEAVRRQARLAATLALIDHVDADRMPTSEAFAAHGRSS